MENDVSDEYFYERRLPAINELVMAQVHEIDDNGIVCKLLEYGSIEAFLPFSEVTRKRLRSAKDIVQKGKTKIFQVIRVEKGYVDLSKKYVTPELSNEGSEKYEKGKHINSIMIQLAKDADISYRNVCDAIAYPLYSICDQRAEEAEEVLERNHPYYILKDWVFNKGVYSTKNTDDSLPSGYSTEDNAEHIDYQEEIDLAFSKIKFMKPSNSSSGDGLLDKLEKIIRQRMTPKESKLDLTVEISCYTYEGIDAIKKVVKDIKTRHPDISIVYKSAPEYIMRCTSIDETRTRERLLIVYEDLKYNMEKVGGLVAMATQKSTSSETVI